eukprot:CAMPEP_0183829806 /NCGR_PEP_ID=MMETSP0807_2-20130328/3605_1 /TAXON_ID=88271 /ORGANISM="Picocystis salinarum, Strain CCMP1897" /LENGTH=389 /DNA_ID=CAMNT_0026075095 /DNA_START=32 /DNA_END=1201 /DNA_ORIENTATION=-
MDDEAHVRVEVRGELVQEERLGRMHLQVRRRWTAKHVLEHLKAKAKQPEREDLQLVYQGTLLQEQEVLGEQLDDGEPDKVHVLYVVKRKGKDAKNVSDEKGKRREAHEVDQNGEKTEQEETKQGEHTRERYTRRDAAPEVLRSMLWNPIFEEAYEAALVAVIEACQGTATNERWKRNGDAEENAGTSNTHLLDFDDANIGPPPFPVSRQEHDRRQDPGMEQHEDFSRQGVARRRHPPDGREQGAIPRNQNAARQQAPRQYRIRFQVRVDVWLMLKLASMVFVLNQGGSPPRLAVLSTIAAFLYVAQTGGLERLRGTFLPVWNSFLTSMNDRVGGENGSQLGILGRAFFEAKVFFFGFLSSLMPGWNFQPQPPVHAQNGQEQQQERPHQE